MKIVHLEEGLKFNPQRPFPERENKMIELLIKNSRAGIFIFGYLHMESICRSKRLQEIFHILPINAVTRKEIKMLLGIEKPSKSDEVFFGSIDAFYKRFNFAFNDKKVLQLSGLENDKQLMSSDQALMMVIKAANKFYKKQARFAEEKRNKAIEEASKQELMLAAGQASISSLPITAPTATGLLLLKHYDSSQSSLYPAYPLETVPFHQLLQLGFWGAAQRGFCAKPREWATIDHDSSQQEKFADNNRRTAIAERALPGSSLESALRFFFKKTFSNKAFVKHAKNQPLAKEFLIRICNGEASTAIRESFQQHVAITNKHLREKELIKLAKRDQQEAINHQLGLRR